MRKSDELEEPKLMHTDRLVRGLITVTMVAATSITLVSPASAATPKCFGQKATKTHVNSDGVILGTKHDDVIVGTKGDDVIAGKGGHDLICGLGGDDYVFDFSGNDKINGGKGEDKIDFQLSSKGVSANLGTGKASGGAGSDVIKGFEDLIGTNFTDHLTGSNENNLMAGLDGNDVMDGGSGLDILEGSGGDDSIDGGTAAPGETPSDVVWYHQSFADNGPSSAVSVDLSTGSSSGGAGNDTLSRISGIVGSKFNDTLTGNNSSNFILGMEGDDTINGGGVQSQSNFDESVYWFASSAVTVNLQTGKTSGGDGVDTLSNISGVYGSNDWADTLIGDQNNNYLDAAGVKPGTTATESIQGGNGDDWMVSNASNENFDGGPGSYDLVDFQNDFTGSVTVNLATGTATGYGSDTLANVEAAQGTVFDDHLTGDNNVNYFFGWLGNDTIVGAGGNDEIDAGSGFIDTSGYHPTGDMDNVDGGDGSDTCVNANPPETNNCETKTTTTGSITPQPLTQAAEASQTFRHSF